MKAFIYYLLAGALLLGAASCIREMGDPFDRQEPAAPVTIIAQIADETKATLNDSSGNFAFSEGDAIKIYNGSDVYASTGISISGTSATFTMADGFTDTGSGFAAFPAGIVGSISGSGVTFNLPSSYTYAQVGGTLPDTARVPCPMMATYTAGQKLSFKQAGAVVRFRITECEAGSITFTFTSKVTGTVTLSAVPSGTNDGILAGNLSSPGYSITVTEVPQVTTGNYIYITLPVPVGTDPLNVGVWNHGASMNKVATLRNATPGSLNRAGGYKRGVSLTDVKNTAKFNRLILAGDLCYNKGTGTYSLLEDPLEVLKYYSVDYTTSNSDDKGIKKYFFNWNFLNAADFQFTIGSDTFRVPTSGNEGDWAKIADTTGTYIRSGSTVKDIAAKYAYVTVNGLDNSVYHTSSIGGLLLFPDSSIIAVTSGAKLNIFNTNDEADNNTLTLSALTDLRNQGCSFLPTSGFWKEGNWYFFYTNAGWFGINEVGTFWSGSKLDSDKAYALTILRNHTSNTPRNLIDPEAYDKTKEIYYPVRLIRVPPTP